MTMRRGMRISPGCSSVLKIRITPDVLILLKGCRSAQRLTVVNDTSAWSDSVPIDRQGISPMTVRNLEHAVHPRSVAVIGASVRKGSVGRVVINNIVNGGIRRRSLAGESQIQGGCRAALLLAHQGYSCSSRPCRHRHTARHGAGHHSRTRREGHAGGRRDHCGNYRENGLRQAMLDAAKPYLFRIIGPNTVGLILPSAQTQRQLSRIWRRSPATLRCSHSRARSPRR